MKTRRWRRLALATSVVLGVAGAVGCSLGFHPSDYEDSSGEDDAALPPHDASPATDATTNDASTLSDAPSATDAAVDAGDAAFADGPALGFCQMPMEAVFCADFDEGGVQAGWDDSYTAHSAYGTLALDTDASVSAPASMHVTLPALPTDADAGVGESLLMRYPTKVREVALDFDFAIKQLGGYHVAFVSLVFSQEGIGVNMALGVNKTTQLGMNIQLTAASSGWSFDDFDYPSDGDWHHVRIDMVVAPDQGGSVNVSVDRVPTSTWPALSFDVDAAVAAAETLVLQIGVDRTDGTVTPALDVHFDNVVVTLP